MRFVVIALRATVSERRQLAADILQLLNGGNRLRVATLPG